MTCQLPDCSEEERDYMAYAAKVMALVVSIAFVLAMVFNLNIAYAQAQGHATDVSRVENMDRRLRHVENNAAAHNAAAQATIDGLVKSLNNIERVSNENALRLTYLLGAGGGLGLLFVLLRLAAFFDIKPTFRGRGK